MEGSTNQSKVDTVVQRKRLITRETRESKKQRVPAYQLRSTLCHHCHEHDKHDGTCATNEDGPGIARKDIDGNPDLSITRIISPMFDGSKIVCSPA